MTQRVSRAFSLLILVLSFSVLAHATVNIYGTIPSTILQNQHIQFSTNSSAPVWSIVGPGSITVNGLYTTPSVFPPAPTNSRGTPVYVVVTDSTSGVSASVTVWLPSGSSFIINPTHVTLSPGQTFQFSTNASSPVWSVDIGTISPGGLYTAPISQSAFGTQYTQNTLNATVRAVTGGFAASAVVVVVFPVQTATEQALSNFLLTWPGSPALTTVGTITSGQISANLLTGALTVGVLPTIPSTKISGLALSATIDTTNASNITSGVLGLAQIPSGIPASKITGLSTSSTTDAGNITSGTLAVARLPLIPLYLIPGLASSATIDTTNASNITSGTLPVGQLPSGIPISLTTGVLSLAQVPSGIPVSKISGLTPSGTIDTTNASNITSGTLDAARLPTNIPVTDITGLAASATVNTTSASNITFGTLPLAQLPATIPMSKITGVLPVGQVPTNIPGSSIVGAVPGNVSSVSLSASIPWLTASGTVTSTGTLSLAATGSLGANLFVATPSGSTGSVSTLRAITSLDLPSSISSNTSGTAGGLNGTGLFTIAGTIGTAPSVTSGKVGLWLDSTDLNLHSLDSTNNKSTMVRYLTSGVSTACAVGAYVSGFGNNGVPTCTAVTAPFYKGNGLATFVLGSAVGSGAVISAGTTFGNDFAGSLNFTSGGSPPGIGPIVTVTFPTPYSSVPSCVVANDLLGGPVIAVVPALSWTVNATTLVIGNNSFTPLASSANYFMSYICGN